MFGWRGRGQRFVCTVRADDLLSIWRAMKGFSGIQSLLIVSGASRLVDSC